MSLKKKPTVVTFEELCRQNTAPVLRPDSNWVKEDGPLLAKGNVLKALAHPGAPFGSFADRADTDANHNVLKVTTAGTFFGQFGKLVIHTNGSYTYTLYSNADKPAAFAKVQGLSDGERLTESFKYKATDGFVTKGSILKITIFGTDDPVTISDINLEGGDTIVDEDGLPGALLDGTPLLRPGEVDSNELAANTGDFKVTAPDGIDDLVVGGTLVISNGVFIPGVVITTPLGNQLAITGFNAATGVVSYTYTLLAPESHPGAGEDSIFDNILVKLTDEDGSSATATLKVEVVDDQPMIEVCQNFSEDARFNVVVDECIPPSLLSVDETDLGTDATSNFAGIFDSNFGADGPGSITFAVDTSGGPSGLIDTVTGFVVTVAKEGNDIVGRIGPNPADVVFVISIDAVTGTVTFDQQRAVVHDPNFGPNDFEFLPFDLVKVVATITDADGDTDSATYNAGNLFGFFDAAPTAQDEPAQSVAEGATITGVFDFAPGSDGATVTAINGTPLVFGADGFSQNVDLGLGSIKVKADGTYELTADNPTNNPVKITGTFTVTDGDGDPDNGAFEFDITDANAPTGGTATATVDDDGLPGGNSASIIGDLDANTGDDPADVSEATFTGTLGGSVGLDVPGTFSFAPALNGASIAVGLETATLAVAGNILTATGPRGPLFQVVITNPATGAYHVTLLDNVLHAGGPNYEELNAVVDLGYVITDSDGSTANGTLSIVFDDDAPTVALNFSMYGDTVLDETATTSTAPTISIGAFVAGDDPDVGGTGVIATANSIGPVVVPTIAFGADGAAATNSVAYSLSVGSVPPGLAVTDGSLIELVQVSPTVVVGKVVGGAFDGQVAFAVEIDAAAGTLKVEQYLSLDHPLNPDPNDVLDIADFALIAVVTVTDGDNDVASAGYTIGDKIRFFDDGASAANDSDSIAAGAYGPATGNVITGLDGVGGDANATDGVADSSGADGGLAVTAITGFGGAGAIGGTTTGQYGNLTINADGSYSYTRNPGTPGGVSDVFTYTVADGDGDTTTATLTIAIGDARPVTAANGAVQLDDDAVPGAGGNPGGTGDDPDSINATGFLSGSGGDGPLTWSMISVTTPLDFTASFVNSSLTEVFQGTTKVMAITLDTATGAYTVTQLAPIAHPAGTNENNSNFSLGYLVTDSDGDFANGSLHINIDDDTAIAVNDTDVIPSGSVLPAVGNVITDAEGDGGADSVGADGGAAIVAITGFGGAGAIGGLTTGQYGQLTINSDGGYSYTRNPGTPGGVTDTFTYTLTDGDGDTTTATLSITINNSIPITGTNATVQLDDDALAGGNAGGTGDDANALNTTGTLSASGGDGALTFAFGSITVPPALSFTVDSPNATTRLVKQSGITVLTITIDMATGGYIVTQNAPISHPSGGNENNLDFTVGYTVTDADGESANGTLAINIDDDTAIANVVVNPNLTDDEGKGAFAANSIEGQTTPLATDADVTASPATASGGAGTLFSIGADGLGSISVTGPAGVLAIYKLASGLPGQEVVAYTSVTDGSGNVTLTGKGAVSGNTAFTLKVNADGSYLFTQSAALVHPLFNPANEDDLPLAFTFTFTDKDGDPASGSLTVTVDDDTPVGGAVTKTINESADVDTNVSLILDVSGSMGDPSGLTGLTRLDVLKASVIELLEQYDALGNVAVRIVTFDTNAAAIGSVWMSVADAKAAVQALVPLNSTNYDEALTDIMAAFGSAGKITGAQNVAYFISDGQPNQPSGSAGIDATEQAAWESFLDTNNIVAHALGAGSGVTVSALDPIAFNGVTGSQIAPLVVTDLGQLTATLVATVTGATTTGNLLTEGAGNFGADGGYLSSVAIGGKTFTYDPVTDAITASGAGTATFTFNATTNVLTIATAIGGQLAVDLDNGAYTYTGPASVPSNQSDVFTYTLKDGDGDTASATFTVNILNEDRAPIVRDDAIITNIGGSGAAIVIPTFALTYNDSDPDGQAITVTAAGSVVDATSAVLGAGIVTFNDNDTDGGAFAYTGSTTAPAGSDTATVTVTRVSATTDPLNGNGLANILIDNDSANTLNGFEGNDVLIGNGGNDILVGGAGADVMQGGAGDDIFDFNAVSESPTLALADTILDFNTASAGEKIDLAGIFGGTLAFQGAQSTATVANTVTWSQDAGTNTTIVRADVDGNTTADFFIKLTGLLTLTAGDFNL